MAAVKLQLPVIQNWSCHNCGGCCREHLIEITAAEKAVIEKQGWTAKDGTPADRDLILKHGRNTFRLNHADDGGCVFLDDKGLCRIHAKFGEPAKPLACRLYPYTFHPSSERGATVSLRFSCPSVVQNLGSAVTDQQADLQSMAREVVGKHRTDDPPLIHDAAPHGPQQTSWADFHKLVQALRDSLADQGVHFAVRLLRTLAWLELIEQSQFITMTGDKLDDLIQIVTTASIKAQPDNELPDLRPGRTARTLFRQIVAQCARHDTVVDQKGGLSVRWNLLKTILKFVYGRGTVPRMPGSASVEKAFPTDIVREATFENLEGQFEARTEQVDALFARYFDVKLAGLHFCGAANFHLTAVEGFRSLALMYPVTLWLARWRAFERGADQVSLPDVSAALATADHNFAYSPALGTKSAQKRLKQLAGLGAIEQLINWYSR